MDTNVQDYTSFTRVLSVFNLEESTFWPIWRFCENDLKQLVGVEIPFEFKF